ncbi:MAG: 23S rRNA (uracil(1939)-C(5))-methyltransferase RlmD, partial [Desulfuromonas sp.]|nr:23S rRNA (uracil(1939)-C(5))-methyltransferase RlmD [Desulfuromonas sp.]
MKKPGSRPAKKRPTPPAVTTTVTIDSLNDDGVGVGRHEKKEILIANTLPGEEVKAVIEHEGQTRCIGRLTKVLKKSVQRVIPGCSLAPQCPGCPLIHLAYPHQLEYKQQLIAGAISHYPSVQNLEPDTIWAAPQTFGYRTTAKLAISKHHGKASVGLYKRGTHDVIDIGQCPQHHPLINKV